MTFEEEFPSLKGLTKAIENPTNKIIHLNMVPDVNGAIVLVEDIQKHCLDKERVKDALRFWFKEDLTTVKTTEERLKKIIEELGL